MSAEVPFELAHELEAFRSTRFISPAEMIVRQQSSRRVFDMFMQYYGGEPQKFKPEKRTRKEKGRAVETVTHFGPHVLERTGYVYPQVVRSREGQGDVPYPGIEVSGYTGLGRLVHVRFNPDHWEPQNRFLVAIGDLAQGELSEPLVVDAQHEKDRTGRLETTLYLEGADSRWPKQFWPQIQMTHDGATYYPGGDRRVEAVRGIHDLYMRTRGIGKVALAGPNLHAVQ